MNYSKSLNDKPKVLHVIVGLNIGGAERMLLRLVKNSHSYDHVVVSLTNIGKIGLEIQKYGVRVIHLGLSGQPSFFQLKRFYELYKICKRVNPDIVQTWMYHADLFGGLIARLSGCKYVVWNIRNNNIPQGIFSLTGFIIKLCSIFSYFIPKKIVCVGTSVANFHTRLGYDSKKLVVIENGYEFDSIFNEVVHNTADNEFVIGIIGRFDPLKGYEVFLKSLKHFFIESKKPTKIVMAGRGISLSNRPFFELFNSFNLPIEFFYFYDEIDSVSSFYRKIDLLVSSSVSEGFPNVVVEAMACGVPCLVTKVGESETIVGRCGWVVPPNDALALKEKLMEIRDISSEELRTIGMKARERVHRNYSITKVVKKYECLYKDLIK